MKPKTRSVPWTVALALTLLLATASTVTTGWAAQRGRSPIYDFDLSYNGTVAGKVGGKVTVNMGSQPLPSYVLVAHGLMPNTKYTIGYTALDRLGHTEPELEPYVLGSVESPKAGALTLQGMFHLGDLLDLESAQFWIMETPPGATSGYINGLVLGNYWGWFITKIACYYSKDEGATWIESDHTDGIARGESKRVDLEDLGVPEGALVKIHAIVVGGKDRTGSEIFRCSHMPCGLEYSHRYASYYIDGVTWKPVLYFRGTVDIR